MKNTKTAQPTTVLDDQEYFEAHEYAEQHREALRTLKASREEVRRALNTGAPFEFDLEATLANADMPETDRPQTPLQEKFEWLSQQIRALTNHTREAEITERRVRTQATNRIAATYKEACAARAKKYMTLIGALYEIGLEQERMIQHLDTEAAITQVYTPASLQPLPPFHRTHLIAGAAILHKGLGLPLPKAISDDEYARTHMAGVHSLNVKVA